MVPFSRSSLKGVRVAAAPPPFGGMDRGAGLASTFCVLPQRLEWHYLDQAGAAR
jgi:hypothetical protein